MGCQLACIAGHRGCHDIVDLPPTRHLLTLSLLVQGWKSCRRQGQQGMDDRVEVPYTLCRPASSRDSKFLASATAATRSYRISSSEAPPTVDIFNQSLSQLSHNKAPNDAAEVCHLHVSHCACFAPLKQSMLFGPALSLAVFTPLSGRE